MKRRDLLTWLAAPAVLAACGKPDAPAASAVADATTPKAGGELVFAFDGAAVSQFVLDPHASAFAPHNRVMRSIYDSLVVALPDHQFGPWLAKAWEVSPDGLTYTFKLRDDVRFHDGTRFDAAAVKANLDRIKDPKNALFTATDLGSHQATNVVDDFTVQVVFATPFPAFIASLSKTNFGIVSPAAIAKFGPLVNANPVGTGPFRYLSQQAGTEIVLERNPDHQWSPAGARHTGPAYLDRLVFKNVPEEATRVAVLQSGQAGAADLIPPQNLVGIRQSTEFRLSEGELLNHNYSLYLNVRRDPWSDPRVREAFKLSLDLDTAVKTIYLGTAQRAWSPLSPSLLGYDPALENTWRVDRARAAALLDDAGWTVGEDGVRAKGGKRLTVVFLETQGNREKRLDLITMLRRQLRDTGFELRIESQPGGSYLQKSTAGDFDLLAGSQFAPDPDVLRRIHAPGLRARSSVSKVDDPELSTVLESASRELDPVRRVDAYKRAQRLIVDRVYAIPVYVLVYTVAAARKVHGIAVDVHGFPVLYDTFISEA